MVATKKVVEAFVPVVGIVGVEHQWSSGIDLIVEVEVEVVVVDPDLIYSHLY